MHITALLKEITFTKFDASVDIDVRLGVDPRKANQMVRGVVTLPHGTGKTVRVLVLCTPEKEAEAQAAGADDTFEYDNGTDNQTGSDGDSKYKKGSWKTSNDNSSGSSPSSSRRTYS